MVSYEKFLKNNRRNFLMNPCWRNLWRNCYGNTWINFRMNIWRNSWKKLAQKVIFCTFLYIFNFVWKSAIVRPLSKFHFNKIKRWFNFSTARLIGDRPQWGMREPAVSVMEPPRICLPDGWRRRCAMVKHRGFTHKWQRDWGHPRLSWGRAYMDFLECGLFCKNVTLFV